jgi:hypothetical protein
MKGITHIIYTKRHIIEIFLKVKTKSIKNKK